MAEKTRLHLDVTLDLDGETISGTVHHRGGPGVEFTGWLEFMSAFETVIASARTTSERAVDPGGRP